MVCSEIMALPYIMRHCVNSARSDKSRESTFVSVEWNLSIYKTVPQVFNYDL